MKDITLTIPDNCELVKAGNTYVIKEKDTKPKSWAEFCASNKIGLTEYHIADDSTIIQSVPETHRRNDISDRNVCVSKEEAEAFLALMQLRQLRKAWVGDWKPTEKERDYGIIAAKDGSLEISCYDSLHRNMLFPTEAMAKDFLNCFRGLCETAKILL